MGTLTLVIPDVDGVADSLRLGLDRTSSIVGDCVFCTGPFPKVDWFMSMRCLECTMTGTGTFRPNGIVELVLGTMSDKWSLGVVEDVMKSLFSL